VQALTVAVSPSGIQYFTQELVANAMVTALKGLVPPTTTINPANITLSVSSSGAVVEAENIVITLSNGSVTNFQPQFQSVTQGNNGLFTVVLVATNVTVNYSWNEQWDEYYIYMWINKNEGRQNNTWGYSMGIDTFTITVPVTVTQQADSYQLTVGTVTPTPTGLSPHVPSGSIVQEPAGCFSTAVNATTIKALENIDFQGPIQSLLGSLFGTIPASGQLSPNIVFHFNQGDSPITFPSNAGIAGGVTGNVSWKGTAYSGGTPPSLPVPPVPSSRHAQFYIADYEFNELYWAYFEDGLLNTTITGSQLPDPQMLNTGYYQNGPLAPLYQKYPNLPMTVGVTPTAAPTVTFQQVYDLDYGDNGVLTTQQAQLPTPVYNQLKTLAGSVYLDQGSFTVAAQAVLGPGGAPYLTQIEQASIVPGSWTQTYVVTAAGLASLQSSLPSGVYSLLAAALAVGQVFLDKAWLLVAVQYALDNITETNQYAGQIAAAFAHTGSFSQVWWVTPGINGGLTTLVDQLPPDAYNNLLGLANTVYLTQASFLNDLQNALGNQASQYAAQVEAAALVNGAIVTHTVQAVFNVLRAGQTIPVFTVAFAETDFQQNFRLGTAGYNQTVQFDVQLIGSGTSATLVSSTIPGINASTFPTIWNFVLQPVYALELQKIGQTGVPLPFMKGFQFLFEQATVTVQPGYAAVLTNVQYIGSPQFTEALISGQDAALAEVAPKLRAPRPLGPRNWAVLGPYRDERQLSRSPQAAEETRLAGGATIVLPEASRVGG
jgi:hypothetical protein